jgi:hypothetical protein
MIDISICQYCHVKYEECTCCKYCSFLKGTCECHLEGEWPCTKFHPADMYKSFFNNPEMCSMFGHLSIEDIDRAVMNTYSKEVWPQRLKEND